MEMALPIIVIIVGAVIALTRPSAGNSTMKFGTLIQWVIIIVLAGIIVLGGILWATSLPAQMPTYR